MELASILGCEPIDGVLGVRSSTKINIATFSTSWETHISHLVDNILVWVISKYLGGYSF